MIAVVECKLISNLLAQMSVDAICKYFSKYPNPCFECSLANLQRMFSPPSAIHNPLVPIGAHWSLDFGEFNGTDDLKKFLTYGDGFANSPICVFEF